MPSGTPALVIAAILFAIFFADVSAGAFAKTSLIGDVGEMLTLLASSVAFVIGVLMRERAAQSADRD